AVTSFTDGTKIHLEQALVANGVGATIPDGGMRGPAVNDLKSAAAAVAESALATGRPIVEFVVSNKLPHGVFVIGRHDPRQKPALQYLKLGDGPLYVLVRHNIFAHLEILKTIKRVVLRGVPLLDNSRAPTISVAAVAKRDLEPGEALSSGVGSFA